jgi:hypothetical protein
MESLLLESSDWCQKSMNGLWSDGIGFISQFHQ